MAQNSHELKIVKTAELPQSLDMGFDYAIAGKISITDINKHDDQNGEVTYTYKGQLIAVEIVNKLGATFKGVAKGSQSQKMRFMIINKYGVDAYEVIMQQFLNNFDEITEKYVKN